MIQIPVSKLTFMPRLALRIPEVDHVCLKTSNKYKLAKSIKALVVPRFQDSHRPRLYAVGIHGNAMMLEFNTIKFQHITGHHEWRMYKWHLFKQPRRHEIKAYTWCAHPVAPGSYIDYNDYLVFNNLSDLRRHWLELMSRLRTSRNPPFWNSSKGIWDWNVSATVSDPVEPVFNGDPVDLRDPNIEFVP